MLKRLWWYFYSTPRGSTSCCQVMHPFSAEIEPRWRIFTAHSPVHLCLTCMDITEGTIWFAHEAAAEVVTVQEMTSMFAPAWKMGVSHILQSGTEEDGLKASDHRGEVGYLTIGALDNLFLSYIQAVFLSIYSQSPSSRFGSSHAVKSFSQDAGNCCDLYTLTF